MVLLDWHLFDQQRQRLERLSRDVHFISGLMAHKVPFLVAELGPNVDPFVLHHVAREDAVEAMS